MADCVISAVADTECGNALVPACIVHAAHAPCMHDGEPACPAPLHSFPGSGTRDEALRMWRLRTRGQRPLIIHTDAIPDPQGHVYGDEVMPCPCGAEIIPPGGTGD